MSARKELSRARKALARGRGDEALVLLWNLVEQARLEEDAEALQEIGELAARIAATEESSRNEAERLLETLGRRVPMHAEPRPARPVDSIPEEPASGDVLEPVDWGPDESAVPAEDGFADSDGGEAEPVRRRSRARYVIPAVTVLFILLNLIARVLGD